MAWLKELKLAFDHSALGSLPADKQTAISNGFNPVVASLASAMAEFLIGFSVLFMLMNGVFTGYFTVSTSLVSLSVKVLLFVIAAEGLYRTFSIILDKKQSVGSVFYTALEILSATVSSLFEAVLRVIPKPKKPTPEERKQKEMAENFKKFIEYGMDQPGLTWERQ